MKKPLNYQTSEYDCGPTAMMNAISYLYDTEEIPPYFIKIVNNYCMDSCSCSGMPCKRGTSSDAMRFMAAWFNNYANDTGFNIHTECIEKEAVNFKVGSEVIECLRSGGVAVVRCVLEDVFHYVTLTGFEGDNVFVFDPYFDDNPDKPEGITLVNDHPKEYNHIVDRTRMDSMGGHDYSMDAFSDRIAVCFYRTERKATKARGSRKKVSEVKK